jgi:hypothetical protein
LHGNIPIWIDRQMNIVKALANSEWCVTTQVSAKVLRVHFAVDRPRFKLVTLGKSLKHTKFLISQLSHGDDGTSKIILSLKQ